MRLKSSVAWEKLWRFSLVSFPDRGKRFKTTQLLSIPSKWEIGLYFRAWKKNATIMHAIIPASMKKNAARLPLFTSLGTHCTFPEFARATRGMHNHVPRAVVKRFKEAEKL